MKPTYDDIRAEATPCLGNCGKLCTHGPRYCPHCSARIIAAIRANHLKANISGTTPHQRLWARAWVDAGGTVFGPGPYVKLPIRDGRTIRVYPPARLRKRLADTEGGRP